MLVQEYWSCPKFNTQGLSACAWVNAEGLSGHPHGDAWLAVAGVDPVIQIISVVEARVIAHLKGAL